MHSWNLQHTQNNIILLWVITLTFGTGYDINYKLVSRVFGETNDIWTVLEILIHLSLLNNVIL